MNEENNLKKWLYRSYSSCSKPRSIVNRRVIFAKNSENAVRKGKALYDDYGRYCTAVKVH